MAPKHVLAAAAKPPKRRRRQSSVLSFFTPQPLSKPRAPVSPSHAAPPAPPSLPSPPSPPSPPCVSSPSPSPPHSSRALHTKAASAPSPPPEYPSLACVSLHGGVDVAPATPTAAPALTVCAAPAVAVHVAPLALAVRTVRARTATAPPPRAPPPRAPPPRSSMRLRSATMASAAAAAAAVAGPKCEHDHDDPIFIDSPCETKRPSSDASTSPITVESDDDSERPVSRLSRRNRKKQSQRPKSAPSSASSTLYPIFNRPKSAASQSCSRNSLSDAADNAGLAPSSLMLPAKPPQKKKLHPFFAATAAAISSAKERSKPAKPLPPLVDAWHCPSATVHVNPASPSHPWRPKPRLAILPPDETDGAASTSPPVAVVAASSPAAPDSSQVCPRFDVVQHNSKNTHLWAEFYKKDGRIDVINGSVIKELVDWLRKWYEAPDASADNSDDDSVDSFLMEEPDDKERVAVITGHTGCGKSTIIATAARHVGLSVLEINASTCRTGKKIREIIGDALNTHRVTHSQFKFSSAKTAEWRERSTPKARTLIVFEDVDELQDDEKGFWTTFQKLAAAGDCRRPIVCTATNFSSKMRHVFDEVKRPMEADMERLLINARVDQALNPPPLPYKHICFSRRTERQSLAVLSRVSGSEAVKTVVDIKDCLALLSRNDSRRAINMLQFWGSSGLVIPHFEEQKVTTGDKNSARRLAEVQDGISLAVLRALVHDFGISFLFQSGSRNFSTEICELSSQKEPKSGRPESPCTESAVLDSWCESLETLSCADSLRGHAASEKQKRCRGSTGNAEDLCMHSDLEGLLIEAEEMDIAAIHFSAEYLSFTNGTQQLRNTSHEAMQGLSQLKNQTTLRVPYSRRPIVSEYMPILRTMALEHERQSGRDKGKREGERYVRRTRSRSKREGFSALNLDPETVSTLKKMSIRTPERQISNKAVQ